MAAKRRRFTAEFKASVVRAALREDKTLAALTTGRSEATIIFRKKLNFIVASRPTAKLMRSRK